MTSNGNMKNGLVDEATLRELGRKGLAIYDRLKAQIEAEHWNEFVAIHVGSEDFAIGKSAGKASREILKTHPPDGQVFIRKIGDEPEYELAARILAGEMMAGTRK